MTIRDADYFKFAGVESIRYGIRNVNLSSGMQEEAFGARRSIQEIAVRGRSKPYFQHIRREPLSLQVSFAFEAAWDKQQIREVCRWLTEQEYYQPLIFTNDNERIFYAMVVDDPVLVHNCLSQGYVNLTFRCNDAYSYSPAAVKIWKWREAPRQMDRSSFLEGEHRQTIGTAGGQITLPTQPISWKDYPAGMSWGQLQS
jgi:predicted phage tail component-like protein